MPSELSICLIVLLTQAALRVTKKEKPSLLTSSTYSEEAAGDASIQLLCSQAFRQQG